jgi:23S rRNA pseudouridine1911/1915/1917 synthase
MSHLGHALLGDEVYASTKTLFEKQHAPLFDGQILHAKRLILTHPRTGERMTFECPLPSNFEKLIELLNKQYE